MRSPRIYRGLEDLTYPFHDATITATHCGPLLVVALDERVEARLLLQHGELMPERENFRRELDSRAHRGSKRGEESDEQRSHPARER